MATCPPYRFCSEGIVATNQTTLTRKESRRIRREQRHSRPCTTKKSFALLRDSAEKRLLFSLRDGDDAVGRLFDPALQTREKLVARQARRQRVEEFDDQRARITHEGPAWPEQPRIERHRQA